MICFGFLFNLQCYIHAKINILFFKLLWLSTISCFNIAFIISYHAFYHIVMIIHTVLIFHVMLIIKKSKSEVNGIILIVRIKRPPLFILVPFGKLLSYFI